MQPVNPLRSADIGNSFPFCSPHQKYITRLGICKGHKKLLQHMQIFGVCIGCQTQGWCRERLNDFTKVCVEFLTPNTRRRFNKPDIAGDKDSIATKAGCFAANCALTCSVVVNNGISNAAKISAVVTRPASCVTPCTSTGTPRRASNKANKGVRLAFLRAPL